MKKEHVYNPYNLFTSKDNSIFFVLLYVSYIFLFICIFVANKPVLIIGYSFKYLRQDTANVAKLLYNLPLVTKSFSLYISRISDRKTRAL